MSQNLPSPPAGAGATTPEGASSNVRLSGASGSAIRSHLSPLPSQPPQIPDHELLRRIGHGSYGEVWLARTVLGELRAVKIVHRSSFEDERPFQREFEGLQKFAPISRSHPSQLAILHVGRNEADGCFYYVMELADAVEIAGEKVGKWESEKEAAANSRKPTIDPQTYTPKTLRSLLSPAHFPTCPPASDSACSPAHFPTRSPALRCPLAPAECVRLGLALAEALGHLHQHGLVHRDIKPSNIIFVGGVPKLADIGLVTDVDASRSFVGTEGYLPPEGPGTPQADIYGLGKVLYELCTGKDRKDYPALPPDLRERSESEQRELLELNAVLVKACATDPRQRYQSAQEMAADLALLQGGKSVRRTRGQQRLWSQVKKAALGLVLLTLMGAGVTRLARQTQRNEAAEGGPPSTNELANALCNKALMNLRGDNQRGYPEVYTNLHRAIELDPHFARPYVGLLELVTREAMPGVKYLPEDNERTITQRLVALAPDSAATECGKSIVAFWDWDFPAAERHARRSIQIHPDYELIHTSYGFMLLEWGRPVEARRELEIARRLNPSKVQVHRMLAHTYYVERDFPRAIEMYRAAINWQALDLVAHHFLGCAHRAMGEYEKAIDIFEARENLKSEQTPPAAARFDRLRQAFKQNGVRGYWQEEWNQAPTNGLYQRARILARLDDTDGAFKLLNQAYQVHERSGPIQDWLTYLVFDEDWDAFRHDPRFKELLDKIGFTKVNPKLRE